MYANYQRGAKRKGCAYEKEHKYLTTIFSLHFLAVFHLSQTVSGGFDQNLAKSGLLLFVILESLKAMDRPIVQWFDMKTT